LKKVLEEVIQGDHQEEIIQRDHQGEVIQEDCQEKGAIQED